MEKALHVLTRQQANQCAPSPSTSPTWPLFSDLGQLKTLNLFGLQGRGICTWAETALAVTGTVEMISTGIDLVDWT